MRTANRTPAGVIARGIAAGVVGTACMTALQELMSRRRRAQAASTTNGSAPPADPWEKAPAPAQLARRVVEGVFQHEVSPERITFFTNAVHWGYGTAMGAVYALGESSLRERPAVHGPLYGLGVWASSYATLVPLGLYEWPWHYRAQSIAKDVSYHLVYGSGVAAGYRLLSAR